MGAQNIFADIPHHLPSELVQSLLNQPGVRIERIVSRGHASPEGFWYDQAGGEWVIVLAGRARLRMECEDTPREMEAGDYLNIPPHARHRVEWTDPGQDTVWLAVHYPRS